MYQTVKCQGEPCTYICVHLYDVCWHSMMCYLICVMWDVKDIQHCHVVCFLDHVVYFSKPQKSSIWDIVSSNMFKNHGLKENQICVVPVITLHSFGSPLKPNVLCGTAGHLTCGVLSQTPHNHLLFSLNQTLQYQIAL